MLLFQFVHPGRLQPFFVFGVCQCSTAVLPGTVDIYLDCVNSDLKSSSFCPLSQNIQPSPQPSEENRLCALNKDPSGNSSARFSRSTFGA